MDQVREAEEIGKVIDQNEFAYLLEFPAKQVGNLLYAPYRIIVKKQIPLGTIQ